MLDLPDLTFPMVKLGANETPWDLKPLLYRGGAVTRSNRAAGLIAQGALGAPIFERLPLVRRMHDELIGVLVGGGSKETVRNIIYSCRYFFAWADETDQPLSLETVASIYFHWADYLQFRYKLANKVSEHTVYDIAMRVASVLDIVLERRFSLLFETSIRRPRRSKLEHNAPANKQNLEQTFLFGHILLDICDALTEQAVWGALPVSIPLHTGAMLEEWSHLPSRQRENTRQRTPWQIEASRLTREAWEADKSLRTRYPLINLRIEAELLIFVAQTGMNFAQAHTMKAGHFHFNSHLGGYQVRRYKARRKGEVEFEIYSEYRSIFDRYLLWRAAIFRDDPDGLLFPLVRSGGRVEGDAPQFTRLRKICSKLGAPFISPQTLRKTRVNWLLRRSRDPEQVAEMAQHTQETLLRQYTEPEPQVAMVEITRFHQQTDPAIAPPGPGQCVSTAPEAVPQMPEGATPPDCISGAGCLFCTHQRDIDNEDHVWSLASFRYLKSLELARSRPPAKRMASPPPHPAALAIDRLTAKLKYFETSSALRGLWVREALTRVEEGDHHPAWSGFIKLTELQS